MEGSMNMYRLGWQTDGVTEPAPDSCSAERLAAARQLLAGLKAAYHSLPARQRAAVQGVLREQAAEAAA
jgi:hypothetical protein